MVHAGRKATMAGTKIWEHGQLDLHNQSLAIDHGMATAMTRMGILGKSYVLFRECERTLGRETGACFAIS